VLIGARVSMGVGAAASVPGTLSLIRHIYPEREARARALGVWAAVSGLALALGPVVGGLLIAAFGWRSVFWFGVILGLAALAVAARTVPESSDPEGRRLDVPGLLVGAAAVTAATFAVISGESDGYGTWWIVLLFAVALVGAVGFVLVERRAPDPVLELGLLGTPAFGAANVVSFGISVSVFSVFFFTALYLQLISSFSGWQIALTFVSLAAAMVVAGPLAGRWTARRGPRAPMTAGCVLAGVGLLLLDHQLAPGVSIASLAWVLAIAGLGFGAAVVASNAAVLTVVSGRRSGMAASTVNTSRELGGVFGVAVLGAIVDAQLTTGLSDKLRALGIPPNFRSIVVDAVTHGGVSASAASANPAAKGHLSLVLKVLAAAEDAAGRGVHNALVVATAIVFASAAAALAAVRR
jgi:MFS family permease